MLPISQSNSTCNWKYVFMIVLFSLPHLILGQDLTVRFKPYTMEQQMSQNSVYTMIQDADGFLWLGTQDGLNRFDGYTFKQFHYAVDDTMSLADDHILALYETRDQYLWVGTKSGGLHRYEPESEAFTRFSIAELLKDSLANQDVYRSILAIREIGKDSLLLGTDIGTLFFDVQNSEGRLLRYSAKPDTTVQAIEIDSNGYLWIGNYRGELYRSKSRASNAVEDHSFRSIPISSRHQIESLFEDRFGDMWIATLGSGIFKYDISSERAAGSPIYHMSDDLGLVSDSVNTIFIDNSDRFWIGYHSRGLGLSRLDTPHKLFSSDPSNSFSITHNAVYSLLVDRSGIIWVGTWNGLNKLSPQFEAFKLLTHYEDNEGYSLLDIVAIEESHAGIIWLGSMNGSLFSYNPVGNRLKRYSKLRRDDNAASIEIFDIMEDSDHLLWITTLGGGIRSLDTKGRFIPEFLNYPFSETAIDANENVVSVLEADKNRIWFGTMHEGLKVFDKKKHTWTLYRDADEKGLTEDYIWPMLKTRNGEVWLGAYEGGLYRYLHQEDRFLPFQPNSGRLTSTRIFSLHEDSQNILWVGTAEGLNRIDPDLNTVTNYQTSDGLPHSRILSIQEDDQGYLWLTTNNGLSRFHPQTQHFKNFYTEDGLQGNRFYARSGFKLADGRLLFGGPNGLNIIDPEKLHTNVSSPKLRFTKLEVNNETRPEFSTVSESNVPITLKHQDRLSVSISVLDYTNVSENQYYYKLNQAGDWNALGNENSISFPSLEYGNYSLFVQGENSEGMRTNELEMKIEVEGPLWRKLWFQTVVMLVFVGIVVGAIVLRTRYILGIQRMRLGIAQSLHDDLGANLSTISIQTGVLQSKSSFGDLERRQLERVSNMARDTAHKIREAVWLIDAEYDTLDRLVTKMRDLAMTMFDGRISCIFKQNPLKMPQWKLKMNFRQNVYYLVKEALNNTNKYAEASSVCLSMELAKNQLFVCIRDDGKGFDLDTVKKGNGIRFMQQRADEIKGQLEIDSTPGNGTSISLRVVIP